MGMDFCRNVSEPFVLQSDYPKEQTLPPDFSKAGNLSGSIDDLFTISDNTEEVDVSLEWLSIFVEDCLSSSGNCNIPPPPPPPPPTTTTNHHHQQQQVVLQKNNFTSKNPAIPPYKNIHNKTNQTTPPSSSLQEFSVPGKPRSKRKRTPSTATTLPAPTPKKTTLLFSDPPLLHQAYWLADSELIVPKKEPNNSCNHNCDSITSNNASNSSSSSVVVDDDDYADHEEEKGLEVGDKGVVVAVEEKENLGSLGSLDVSSNMVQPRRCSHCLAQKTPQWRAGPLGPKTLCNACGVRFKSGRLLPEYRPAKSPTFVSYKHSNSHKKVLEMRMSSVLSSISTSSE